MKKFLLLALMAFMWYATASAQIVYENFEVATAQLAWAAPDGTYNGVVPNQHLDAVNSSSWCGSYTKGATGYSLFWVPNLAQPLDISEYNQFSLKVYCSKATPVLLKFEGPGQAVEKIVTMPAANQWVDLKFDMSAGAFKSGLVKIIIFFDPGVDTSTNTYFFDDLVASKAQVCYENFEGGAQLAWQGLDGVYAGAVANPAPNQINGSATCGQYTKSNTAAYSLLLADYVNPIDLSVYNQFKLKVYATAPTQVLLKLEGTGNIERTQNIAVTNAWQEYTFDFSAAAANGTLHKIIIFFDPGVEASGDTYYFDDLCATTLGPCAGATANPDFIDDFECNRNATYWIGWDSLHVINNPHPTPANNSPRVGQFNEQVGPGTEYGALVVDYQNPIDLSVKNQFSLKLWAPRAGNLLLKMEGSPNNPPKEIPVAVTELNQWVEYTADFSSQAGKGHTRFVMFFNAGVNGTPGDIYYIDDIKLAGPTALPPLETFEEGNPLNLIWQPLDGNSVLHGVFTGPTGNNSPNPVNNSQNVGCYTKGTSPLSTLQAIAPVSFDLSHYPQFNLDVLSPNGGGKVVMQLTSASVGNKSATATITTPGVWETLKFDFSAFSSITDFSEVRLIFNPNTANQGQGWCIDNLRQTEITVDPCVGVTPKPNIIDDYECQRNFTQIFYGLDKLSVVNNPFATTDNSSTKVGKFAHPANDPYAGIGYQFAAPPDLTIFNQLQVQVYATSNNLPFLFKLQGGTTAVEIFDTLKEANKWYTFNVDFSGHIGTDNPQLVIFPNVTNNDAGTYYVDNVRWGRKGYNGCVSDYEAATTSISNFVYFNNGSYNQPFAVVDNPKKAGINVSNKVGLLVQSGDAPQYAGMYADLDSYVDFKGNKQMTCKVLMDHIGKFTIKVEIFGNTLPPIEATVANTKVNEWELLTFDFSAVADGAKYPRLTIFPDLASVGSGSNISTYFDDIVIGTGQCGSVGTFSPVVTPMSVSPNPVSDRLHVGNLDQVKRMDIYNAFGQRVGSFQTSGDSYTNIDVSRFPTGVYSVAGFDASGALVGNAKFVIQR
jgi:hypothetical protein